MINEKMLLDFQEKIGYVFIDQKLFTQAFVHRSFINENQKSGLKHNERLEFLGDAVLELIVTDFLYLQYIDKTEGELTAHRAALVNAVTLSEVADDLDINKLMLLSKGEARDTGKARQSILADAVEALIGAIYVEGGYEPAKLFVTTFLLSKIEDVIQRGLLKDAKSKVQEKAQEIFGVTPMYKVLKETGPDHDKKFSVGIYFGKDLIAEGGGKSKQEAEQKAANNAIIASGFV
jgi:ribonuclease III